MNETPTQRCYPWFAVVLSLLSTGLGHVYCGRWRRGVTLFMISLSTFPIAIIAATCSPSHEMLYGLVTTVLAVAIVYLFAVVDALRLARTESRSPSRAASSWHDSRFNTLGLYSLLVALGLCAPTAGALLIRSHVFEAFKTAGASMEPNLRQGDHFLINKLDFELDRGDVVVFLAPTWPVDVRYVRRVIALPGDRVAIRDGQVIVNGAPLGERSNGEQLVDEQAGSVVYNVRYESEMESEFEEQTVPDGEYFMLGDNRSRTIDSRNFSFVPIDSIIGEVQYIYLTGSVGESRFGAFQAER